MSTAFTLLHYGDHKEFNSGFEFVPLNNYIYQFTRHYISERIGLTVHKCIDKGIKFKIYEKMMTYKKDHTESIVIVLEDDEYAMILRLSGDYPVDNDWVGE